MVPPRMSIRWLRLKNDELTNEFSSSRTVQGSSTSSIKNGYIYILGKVYDSKVWVSAKKKLEFVTI